MVCHCLMQNDYQCALAYADTIIAGLLAFATGTMLFPALIGSRMPEVSFMTSPLFRH